MKPINRSHEHRSDAEWLESARRRASFVLLRNGSIVLSGERAVTWASSEAFESAEAWLLGEQDEPVFAVCLDDDTWTRLTAQQKVELLGWRDLVGELEISDAQLAAYAVSLERWHDRARFCGRCGAPTRSEEAGHSRACTREGCGEREFPRTDPVVIAVISNGDRCLLGRHNRARSKAFFTALAGFVEPGESAEEAVAREIFEEAGVRVKDVRYFSSQPWPFPHSLMLGFHARTDDEEIRIDPVELLEARWFTREEILGGTFPFPPPFTIANRLIVSWAEGRAGSE